MEAYIGWLIPIIGLPLSWIISEGGRKYSSGGKFMFAAVNSFALMLVLIFISVLANTLCIEVLHICESHGDGNMSYWFNAFFISPIYFIVILARTNSEKA